MSERAPMERGPEQYYPAPAEPTRDSGESISEEEMAALEDRIYERLTYKPKQKKVAVEFRDMWDVTPGNEPAKPVAGVESQESPEDTKEHIHQAIDKFYSLIEEAKGNRFVNFNFTDEHGPTFRTTFLILIRESGTETETGYILSDGVEVLCDKRPTATQFTFAHGLPRKIGGNPNVRLS